ncbi:MAG: hypothetical protein JWN71_3044 [Xanthobacteraceae bacterium]|jgi:hypothetical protein|nr:hypothetical protein [Xanthobacteraceae bacterium]
MNQAPSTAAAASMPAPVTHPAEAEQLVGHLTEVMDALLGTVEEETKLVRSGKLRQAIRLEGAKADLTKLYIADIARIKASEGFISKLIPNTVQALRQRHDVFRALLQINLTVLATAHAVAEGIVRGVSGEMAKKAAPSTYGRTGVANAPARSAYQPIAVSRKL